MPNVQISNIEDSKAEKGFWLEMSRDFLKNKSIYFMFLPVFVYYIVFHYIPMGGIIVAFQNFKPAKGLLGSDWVGFDNFVDFFTGPYAWRLIKNTVLLSFYEMLFGFPAPILFALALNEIRNSLYKRISQTVSYLPHFISMVVACGMIVDFVQSKGVITIILSYFGFPKTDLLSVPGYFRTIFVASGIWKSVGWGSIIYLATLSNVDLNIYEAAIIDGAGRFKQMLHVTFPSLVPIISVQLILQIGRMMSHGAEKVILLYSPVTYETSDIISSYVYRVGLEQTNYSMASAVGLFNAIINLGLLTYANWFSRKYVKESLW